MNLEHLSKDVLTVFERLDDADVRTAGTTYLMYRGRHRHEVSADTALTRIAGDDLPPRGVRAEGALLRRHLRLAQDAVPLPARPAGRSATSTPAASASTWSSTTCSTSCSSRCPTTTRTRTRTGRSRRSTSLAAADRQLERLMAPAGGPEAFLEDHAVIVCSDHSQSRVEEEIDLFRAFDELGVLPAARAREAPGAQVAVCPNSRAAQVYVLDRDRRRELMPRIVDTLLGLEGVDLVLTMTDHPDGEAAIRGARGGGTRKELRFAPGGDLEDARGGRWHVEGDLDLLALHVQRRPDRVGDLPGRARARVVGAAHAHGRRGARLGQARLRVPGLGRRAPRRRRLARLAARQRLARLAAVVRHRPGLARTRASSGRCATSSR